MREFTSFSFVVILVNQIFVITSDDFCSISLSICQISFSSSASDNSDNDNYN